MGAHMLALQVVVPLVSAPLCVLMRPHRVAWAFSLAVSWAVLIIAALLLAEVLEPGPVTYAMGGGLPPGASNTESMRSGRSWS